MEIKIWVDHWQMQCCGDPFAVGGEVSWTLRAPDTAWLAAVLGDDVAGGIDKAEEHHGNLSESATPTTGVVVSIQTVHCRYGPPPEGPDTYLGPIPGSGVVDTVESADGWTPDRGDLKFVGYVVQLRDEHTPEAAVVAAAPDGEPRSE